MTEVDHASEEFLISEISRQFPGHSFLAEESGASTSQNEHLWIIDPLDGTVNYAHGVPFFCVSIAYSYLGQVLLGAIYDPMRNEMFSAERGQGARVNGRLLKVSGAQELQQSLMVTGFPYDSWNNGRNNFDYFAKLGKITQGVRRLGWILGIFPACLGCRRRWSDRGRGRGTGDQYTGPTRVSGGAHLHHGLQPSALPQAVRTTPVNRKPYQQGAG